jgi:hypothetical protein
MLKSIVERHAKRLGVDPERAYGHAMLFAILVGIMENGGRLEGSNPHSSAKGLYQFVAGSVGPAVNRLRRNWKEEPWMSEVVQHKDTGRLTWEQQTALFLADLLEKRGSDYLMKQVLLWGDANSMTQAYYVLHHTNPDEPTKARARRIFYGT